MLRQLATRGVFYTYRQSSRSYSSVVGIRNVKLLGPRLCQCSETLKLFRHNSTVVGSNTASSSGIPSEIVNGAELRETTRKTGAEIGTQTGDAETLTVSDGVSAVVGNKGGATLMENTSDLAADPTVQALLNLIPEPPAVPVTNETVETVANVVTQLAANGEPTLASMGLATGWWPSAGVQHALEYLHCDLGLPWWGAIMAGTLIIRLAVFPLVVKSQRTAAKMHNNLPGMQIIQHKITEARLSGNQMMVAKYSQDLMQYMKEKELSPLKQMLVPLTMAPIFMSCFFGLRGMANLPVDSMKTGGLLWFVDLTVPDPTWILPLITSATMWLTLEMGVDGARMTGQQGVFLKYALKVVPLVIFPFTLQFPAALLCYWVSTNAISLGQVLVLKIPVVRETLNIEQLKKHNPDSLPLTQKQKQQGFVGSMKESWTNMKVQKQIEERENYDSADFTRAGRAPIVKTYKYDPTKVKAVQAKSKQ